MAYATGAAADADAFMAALVSFLTGQGWSVNKNNWPTWVAVSKGDCYVNFRKNAYGTINFNDSNGVARVDTRIMCCIASGFTDTAYNTQPDALTNSNIQNSVVINDMTGPLPSYHFYADDTYCHVVVQTRAGCYNHLSFGQLEQLNTAFSPAPSYIGCTWYNWWPNGTGGGSMTSWGGGHSVMFNGDNTQFFVGGADNVTTTKVRSSHFQNFNRWSGPGNSYGGSIFTHFLMTGNMAVNGNTPFMPLMGIVYQTEQPGTFLLGTAPNIRLVSMVGRSAQDQVTLGSDTWDLYPMRKVQELYVIEAPASPAIDNTSAGYGFAIKRT